MSEKKNGEGHMKFTFEFEANEAFMGMIKDAMAKMPEMMARRAEMMAAKSSAKTAEKE